jgi:hypothetical protein
MYGKVRIVPSLSGLDLLVEPTRHFRAGLSHSAASRLRRREGRTYLCKLTSNLCP